VACGFGVGVAVLVVVVGAKPSWPYSATQKAHRWLTVFALQIVSATSAAVSWSNRLPTRSQEAPKSGSQQCPCASWTEPKAESNTQR